MAIINCVFSSGKWYKAIAGSESPWNDKDTFDWSSNYLCYSVREPFLSKLTNTQLVFGKIFTSDKMILTSMMSNSGVIFSDGIESDFIEFNSGAKATISIADKKGYLVI